MPGTSAHVHMQHPRICAPPVAPAQYQLHAMNIGPISQCERQSVRHDHKDQSMRCRRFCWHAQYIAGGGLFKWLTTQLVLLQTEWPSPRLWPCAESEQAQAAQTDITSAMWQADNYQSSCHFAPNDRGQLAEQAKKPVSMHLRKCSTRT